MTNRSPLLAAALLGLSALALPGMAGSAQAAGIADTAAISAHSTDMLAASAFGVSVGTGRGVRVGFVVGTPKAVHKRKHHRRFH